MVKEATVLKAHAPEENQPIQTKSFSYLMRNFFLSGSKDNEPEQQILLF
jgi:hypothetical protein